MSKQVLQKETLLKQLQNYKPVLSERFGIKKIALFGSFARDEATQSSDIDLVILEMKEKKLKNRLGAKKFLEEKIGRKVDMGYLNSMKSYIRNAVEKELVHV